MTGRHRRNPHRIGYDNDAGVAGASRVKQQNNAAGRALSSLTCSIKDSCWSAAYWTSVTAETRHLNF
jgi:hypothetical protein